MQLAEFATEIFGDSKYFLRLARQANSENDRVLEQRYSRASIFAAWCSLEGWLNHIASNFLRLSDEEVYLHEKALLKQKALEVSNDGYFKMVNRDKWRSIEERLTFILRRFGNYSIDRRKSLWLNYKEMNKLRNAITHPKAWGKTSLRIEVADVEKTLATIKELIELLVTRVYHKKKLSL